MQISADYVRDFARQIEALNKSAGKIIVTEDQRRNLTQRLQDGEADAFEEVVLFMRSICGSYSSISSALACRFYNGIRDASEVAGNYSATMFGEPDYEQVSNMTRSRAAEVASGRNTVPLANLLTDVVSLENRNTAERTVRGNTRRDPAKPRYCIVPGPGACAFCILRASNGYQYADKSQIESHTGCLCIATPVFGDQKVQGYDPKEYEYVYDNARKAYESGNIPEDLQKSIDRTKQIHNEKYKNGEVSRPWKTTNAVLMVMRYQNEGMK